MMFFRHIFLFFILVEAFTLFVVAGEIGFFTTFCLWLLSAFIGVLVIRKQGMDMLMRAQGVVKQNGVPVDNLFGGLCLVFAGLLFLMPGFISDIFAFCLLIPFIRQFLQDRMAPTRTPRPRNDDEIIDGSYVRVEDTVDIIEQKSD